MNQQYDLRQEDGEMEIDLLDLFSYYRHRILWIIGAFIIVALLAGLVTQFLITPQYTATSKMYMVSSSSGSAVDLSDFTIGQSLSSDYVELVKTRPIINQVIKELDLDYTYEDLMNMLEVSVVTDTRILTMSVTSADRQEAMDIANLLAEKAEEELPKLMDTPEPHIAEKAILPTEKSSPSLSRNVLLGALLLTLLVLAIFTVLYLMDDTIKSAEDVEKYFGVLPLTVIPEGKIEGLDKKEEAFKRKKKHKKKKGDA
jgi:capsular polysaccharide biosynthesis protein